MMTMAELQAHDRIQRSRVLEEVVIEIVKRRAEWEHLDSAEQALGQLEEEIRH